MRASEEGDGVRSARKGAVQWQDGPALPEIRERSMRRNSNNRSSIGPSDFGVQQSSRSTIIDERA